MAKTDTVAEAREAFELAAEAEDHNRKDFVDDIRFARLGEQWPERVREQRAREGRPCLTINRMSAFIRQVVNDARLNKPSIKVHPADSLADPETADVYGGLIRNIEYQSNADVAYDTAVEFAVSGGFGYWRVVMDYAYDDAFDLDLKIERVHDPLLVYGDPSSTGADSSNWNSAFVVEMVPTKAFERQWKGADKVNWEDDYRPLGEPWFKDNFVMVAEWWTREEVERPILLLSNGQVLEEKHYLECKDYLDIQGVVVEQQRTIRAHKVTQRILTGAELLETNVWPGRYIPIVPVYGDEVCIDGKRYFRSLIRDAKDPQRMFNYWRTTSTELVALAPKAPYIGPKGAFDTDAAKWASANNQSHPFIEYDVVPNAPNGGMPQRQPFVGVPAGALQEALNASDDMKSIMGIYDASLGARSNETSGRAILARQREGDISTFHFIDNLSRAIRHTGRILIDLIPHVYNKRRMIRVLGEDGQPRQVPLGQPVPITDQNGQPIKDHVYDLARGKYDLTVSTGPSFTTRREEAATHMRELIRSVPEIGAIIGDLYAKNLDFPQADEIAERLAPIAKATVARLSGGDQQQQGVPPDQVQKLAEALQKLQQENAELRMKAGIEQRKIEVDAFEAQTDRIRAVHEMMKPAVPPRAPDQGF